MNTLLILGAGASKAVNNCFPTGFELLQSINSHLFNDKNDVVSNPNEGKYVSDLTNKIISIIESDTIDYESKLKIYKKELYRYTSAYEFEYLRGILSKSISIDAFTDQNNSPMFQTVSKYATAHILKGAEHAFYQSTSKKTKNWIELFLHEFSKDITNFQNISSRLRIVSFNYDRLFSYLFNEFVKSNYPGMTSVHQILDDFCINYLYGSLGSLSDMPFESANDDPRMISAYTRFNLLERKSQTWQPDEKFDAIGFIGFGFDEKNFQNLNLRQFSTAKVYSSHLYPGSVENQRSLLEEVFVKDNIVYFPSIEELVSEIAKLMTSQQ